MSFIKNKTACFFALCFFMQPLFSSPATTTATAPAAATNWSSSSGGESTIKVTASTTSAFAQSTIHDATVGAQLATCKDATSSYPETIMINNGDGTYTCQQIFQNRTSKNAPPPSIKKGQQSSQLGLLHTQSPIIWVPGAHLFQSSSNSAADLPPLESQFDALMNTLSNNTAFVEFFRKVHLNILNELYEHLMNIYTNFNLHHPGSTSSGGSLSINVSDYLTAQETYSINIKTLIVNHLVNLIEEQFNSAVVALMPNVPQLLATKVGKTTILSDYSVDLTEFIVQDISGALTNSQSTYLTALNQYLTFFQDYTSLISIADDTTGFSLYCSIAEDINEQLSTTDMNTMLTKMNPPMFFYDEDTMRALRVIPDLAKKIPSNTTSIGWPQTMKDNAANMTMVKTPSSTHPIAYYTDAKGTITTSEAQASHLYACIQTGANFFQEELLKQPDWLNSEEGILKILRACLGDFSSILDMGILDCCMETLVKNALNLSIAGNDNVASTCQSLIDSWSASDTSSTSSSTSSSTTNTSTDGELPPAPAGLPTAGTTMPAGLPPMGTSSMGSLSGLPAAGTITTTSPGLPPAGTIT